MSPKIEKSDFEKYAGAALKKWLKKVQSHRELKSRIRPGDGAGKLNFQVDLTICTEPRMVKLNEHYRGKKEPTDVLSFAADHFFQGQGVLGDIVICGPVALKQAKLYDHSWKKELDVLLVHGLLHLLRFDHEESAKAAKEMAKWEKKLLGVAADASLMTRAGVAVERGG